MYSNLYVKMTNSWRAIARMARDRLVSANPEDLPLILSVRQGAYHVHINVKLTLCSYGICG
jgi:hypothetical protein